MTIEEEKYLELLDSLDAAKSSLKVSPGREVDYATTPSLPDNPTVIERIRFMIGVDGVARIEGPVGLRSTRGFNDEPLQGKWKGFRSSRLNQQYRVIYKVYKNVVQIFVVDVTAHDYRKK